MKLLIAVLCGLSCAGIAAHFNSGMAFNIGNTVITWTMLGFVGGMVLVFKGGK